MAKPLFNREKPLYRCGEAKGAQEEGHVEKSVQPENPTYQVNGRDGNRDRNGNPSIMKLSM